MNAKRSAGEPLLPLRSPKQPRNALLRPDGTKASPSAPESLLSRWKTVARVVWDLSRDTVSHISQGEFTVCFYN